MLCSRRDLKAVLFILKRARAGDLLVSTRSRLGARALVLVILKGSSGTHHLSYENRKCNISFYLVGGREREFISERKIYKQIFYIYIFNFLLQTFRYCLAF